ncbi:3-hydroxyisobutyrate dehydrogenase, mitochondrial [Trichonephila clavipes]|nr:3-hydroxyisobutyrate dehydrogenase, mitochondrial [Trichonephila clavipes]
MLPSHEQGKVLEEFRDTPTFGHYGLMKLIIVAIRFISLECGSLFLTMLRTVLIVADTKLIIKNHLVYFWHLSTHKGVNAAKNATLTFMVGAKETEFNAVKDILLCMGQNAMHCGPVGTGQGAKICNNMALAISMIGTSEAMNLGIRLGLDPKMMGKILNMSSGRSWASEVYNPVPGVMENVPAASNYHGGFGTALMAKDLGLAQQAALKTASPTPMEEIEDLITFLIHKGRPMVYIDGGNTDLKNIL